MKDPVDHARTTRPHAGESLKDGSNAPGLLAVAVAVVVLVLSLYFFASGQPGTGGPREEHDFAVCREGVYDVAISAIKLAISKGFRVTTNTTIYNNADPESMREMFDTLMGYGVEGMMISPGYQ